MIKSILLWIVVVAGALIAVALSAFAVVLLAAGVGALLARLFPFSMFESTLLSLIALIGVVVVVGRAVTAALRTPALNSDEDDEEEFVDEWDAERENYDWDDEDDWDDERDEEFSDQPDLRPPLRGWQQPIKRSEFEGVGRNEPCPCGSGRKYKNCHGRPGV